MTAVGSLRYRLMRSTGTRSLLRGMFSAMWAEELIKVRIR